ncbi:MAG TPA: hypothetical protein VMV69_14840 [Pirellulales bacterium]|nr:hypothetical protein [Pirellulales bacterium]
MRRAIFILTFLAAATFAARPALAKGGHPSGGHHAAPHAAHHAANKPAPRKSPPHATKSSKPHATPDAATRAGKHAPNPRASNGAKRSPPRPAVGFARSPVSYVHHAAYGTRHGYYYARRGRHRYSRRRMLANQGPSFVKGSDQVVVMNVGARSVSPWATRISAGRSNGPRRSLRFQVTSDTRPGLFQTLPAVSPSGTLTFTPAPGQTGTAVITLLLRNDSAGAGVRNTSRPQTFRIKVAAS